MNYLVYIGLSLFLVGLDFNPIGAVILGVLTGESIYQLFKKVTK